MPDLLTRIANLLQKRKPMVVDDLVAPGQSRTEPLTEHDRKLLGAALQFSTVEADEVSVPRSEIMYVHEHDGFEKILSVFAESHHSRLPVVKRDLDDVQGFILLKDIVGYIANPATFDIKNVLRPCTVVPGSMSIAKVLQHMRHHTVQIAMVVDEYGGTSGLITARDILQQLVGDMHDEHRTSPLMFMPLADGRFKLDPKLMLRDLEERLKISLTDPTADEPTFETVGGYLLHRAGHVPSKGESFLLPNGDTLVVVDADTRRIRLLELIPAK